MIHLIHFLSLLSANEDTPIGADDSDLALNPSIFELSLDYRAIHSFELLLQFVLVCSSDKLYTLAMSLTTD